MKFWPYWDNLNYHSHQYWKTFILVYSLQEKHKIKSSCFLWFCKYSDAPEYWHVTNAICLYSWESRCASIDHFKIFYREWQKFSTPFVIGFGDTRQFDLIASRDDKSCCCPHGKKLKKKAAHCRQSARLLQIKPPNNDTTQKNTT